MIQVIKIIETLVNNPKYYWEDNSRQLEKLSKRVDKAQEKLGLSSKSLIDEVVMLSELRLKAKAKTVFLSNIGSSGSHLFQSCISRIWPSIPLGEIYLSKKIINDVECLNKNEKNLFCEAYLLLHDYTFSQRYNTSAFLINTLHHPKLSKYPQWSKSYKSALLMRNPIDIALSRTFRKSEYRMYLGKEYTSDEEYLSENLDKIGRFLNQADGFGYDCVLRFEDLMIMNKASIDGLMTLIGEPGISQNFVEKKLLEAINDGKGTNRFAGKDKEIPEEIANYAQFKLKPYCDKYGY